MSVSGYRPKRLAVLLPTTVHPSQARQGLLAVLEPSDRDNFWRGCVTDWMDKLTRVPHLDRYLLVRPEDHSYRRDAKRLGWAVTPTWASYLDTHALVDAAERALVDADAVMVIFAGAPSVPPRLVHGVLDELQQNDVVFGPTEQRGYWMLALRTHALQVLRHFSIGSSLVYSDLVEHCRHEGFSLAVTETWFELDTVADLRRLALESKGSVYRACPVAPRSVEFVRSILSSS